MGQVRVECPECNGEGVIEWIGKTPSFGIEYECDGCQGKGWITMFYRSDQLNKTEDNKK